MFSIPIQSPHNPTFHPVPFVFVSECAYERFGFRLSAALLHRRFSNMGFSYYYSCALGDMEGWFLGFVGWRFGG